MAARNASDLPASWCFPPRRSYVASSRLARPCLRCCPRGRPAASAAPNALGTPSGGIVNRANLDTASNFSILDTQQVATGPGAITTIDYYAAGSGTIRFLLTDSTNKVKYQSPAITVTSTGRKSYTLAPALAVATGDRLGYHTSGTGVIPFDQPGSSAQWSAIPSSPPAVGTTMSNGGNGPRIYSFGASGTGLVGHWTFADNTGSEQTGLWSSFTLSAAPRSPTASSP